MNVFEEFHLAPPSLDHHMSIIVDRFMGKISDPAKQGLKTSPPVERFSPLPRQRGELGASEKVEC